jgi:glutamate/aspartate transport system substrate-binding protein
MRTAIGTLLGLVLAASYAHAQPLEGRLKVLQDSGTLKIAYRTDSPPFSFLDAQGQPTGYSIELCRRIAKSLERDLGLSLTLKWVPVDTRTRFESIVAGTADIECGSTTVSLSRLKIVDFSNLIFTEGTGLLVKADVGIARLEDMGGKKIGVIAGSTNARAVKNQIERRKVDATLVEFTDREQGIAELSNGNLHGFATDKTVLQSLAMAAKLHGFIVLPEDLSFEPFAIMLPRGDAAFRLAINTGLAHVFRSGEIIDVYTRYFSGIAPRPSVWLGAVFTFGGLPD